MLYYLIAFCSIAGLGAHAQNPQLGSCPSIKFSRVDPYQMTGQWFDYGRSNDNPTNGETCGYDHWNPSVNGSSKLVLSAHSAYLGNYGDVVGDISFISDNSYIFSFEIPNVGLISVYHAILEVDYNNFVIYYSCTNQGSSYTTSFWVKTRRPYPSFQVESMIRNSLGNHGLSYGRLTRISQQNCYRSNY